jgi:YegS/Rv2252/BmrU family lipid kinase
LIAVGGDGTVNEVVNGFFEGERIISPESVLGIIPQGSGCDLRRVLGIPLDEPGALKVIQQGRVKRIDLEKVSFETPQGSRGLRYGVNITSFGLGGKVAARANRSSKILGPSLTFQLATLLTTLTFRGNTVRLELDGEPARQVKISNIAVGNAQFHGAGMWVCPRAVVDDGLLDVTVIRYLSPWEVVGSLGRLYDGRLLEHPKVESYRARHVNATSEEPTWIEIDGEPVGKLPVEITVLPRALSLYVPSSGSARV